MYSTLSTSNDIYKELKLPFNLYTLNEKDRMALAYAFEERATLVCNLAATEHRHRQQVILARSCELDVLQGKEQLRELNERLDLAVITALTNVTAATSSSDGQEEADHQTHHQNVSQAPWNRPRLPRKNSDIA